jgi:hypothetical protein
MKQKNYFELSSIQGELQGLAKGMKCKSFSYKEGVIKALLELANRVKCIQKTEIIDDININLEGGKKS